jgi:hypothetical protein
MTIQHEGQVIKHILWSAFAFSKRDWERVKEAAEILDVHECHHLLPVAKLMPSDIPRTLIEYNSISLLRNIRLYGVLCL